MAVAVAGLAVLVFVEGVLILMAVRGVHREVTTLRDQATIGTLASQDETRRIEDVPRLDRTTQEQRHLDAAALEDAPYRDVEE